MAEITDVRRQLKFPVNRLGTDLAVLNFGIGGDLVLDYRDGKLPW